MKLTRWAVLLGCCWLLVACNKQEGDAAEAGKHGGGKGMPPMSVEVLTVQPTSTALRQELPARVLPLRSADVRARVAGIVEARWFEEGSEVKAGQSLFQIDADISQAMVDAARAEMERTKRQFERLKPLLALEAISQKEFDVAEAQAKQAEAQWVKAKQDLDNTRVPAPIAGHIGRAMVTEGALVGQGEPTLLATIHQLDQVYVDFSQASSEIFRLRKQIQQGKLQEVESLSVDLILPDGSSYPQAGKLLFRDLVVDSNTGAISARALFNNPTHLLLPGMLVKVSLPQAQVSAGYRVPQRAVVASPRGQVVMLVNAESKVEPRPVKTAGMVEGDFIVLEGLNEGDRVIVEGVQKARPGSEVKASELGSAPAAEGMAPMALGKPKP